MTPSSGPLSEQDIEKHLRELPQFTMSTRGDDLFYTKLNTFIQQQVGYNQSKRLHERPASFFANLQRFAFSFGLGIFVVLGSITALSYRDSVTHGTLLYPWKQISEKIERTLAFSIEQDVRAELRFADRRLHESWSIISESPQSAWLINTAYALSTSTDLETDASVSVNLKLTLNDLNNHITNASRIVESKTLSADKAISLLDMIARRADAQVTSLKTMKNTAPLSSQGAIHAAAVAEEFYVVKVVVAREDILSIAEEKGNEAVIQLAQFSQLTPINVTGNFTTKENAIASDMNSPQEAQKVLSLLEKKIQLVPQNKQARVAARIVDAQRALNEGKIATGYGLSIALTKQIAQMQGMKVKVHDAGTVKTESAVKIKNSQLLPSSSVNISEDSQNNNTDPVVTRQPVQPKQTATVKQVPAKDKNETESGISVFDILNALSEGTNNSSIEGSLSSNTSVGSDSPSLNIESPTLITPTNLFISPETSTSITNETSPTNTTVTPTNPTQIPTPDPNKPISTIIDGGPTVPNATITTTSSTAIESKITLPAEKEVTIPTSPVTPITPIVPKTFNIRPTAPVKK